MNEFAGIWKFLDSCFGKEVLDHIRETYLISFFPSIKGWRKIMLLPQTLSLITYDSKVRIIGGGILAGWVWKEKFIPSPHLYNFIYENTRKLGCAVVAKPHGVKAFLYGNDLLLASLSKLLPPTKKGEYVAVIDPEDYRAVGVGILLYDENEIKVLIEKGEMLTAIVKNVVDLGLHIRNEKFFM
jgi:predicted ribosome-associated RNA-binding protein Tma20